MWIIVITTVIVGGSTVPAMQMLGIRRGELMWSAAKQRSKESDKNKQGLLAKLKRFEKTVLQPALTIPEEDYVDDNNTSPRVMSAARASAEAGNQSDRTSVSPTHSKNMFESEMDQGAFESELNARPMSASILRHDNADTKRRRKSMAQVIPNTANDAEDQRDIPGPASLELQGTVGANDQKWSEIALGLKPSQRRRLSIELGSGVGHVFDFQEKTMPDATSRSSQQQVFTKLMGHLRRGQSEDVGQKSKREHHDMEIFDHVEPDNDFEVVTSSVENPLGNAASSST